MNREDGYESRYRINNKRMHRRKLKIVKKPRKTVDQHIADTRLQDHWAKAHGAEYMNDYADIGYCIRMIKTIWIFCITCGIGSGAVVFCLLYVAQYPIPPLNSMMISVVMAAITCVASYLFMFRNRLDIQRSCKLFEKDWAIYESLDELSRSRDCIENDLRGMANEVSRHQRLRETRKAKAAKRKFTDFHAAMYRFGLCEKDHGHYYPKEGTVIRLM